MAVPVAPDPPLVDAGACANARHAVAGCSRCADVCPVPALELDGRSLPQLDASACVGCGACVPACPLGAITDPRPAHELRIALTDLPDGPVVLSCAPRRRAPITIPGHLIAHGRCLAALGVEDLVEGGADARHPLWLDDTACTGCEIGGLHDRLAACVEDANALATAYGRPPLVQLASMRVPAAPTPAGGWRDTRDGAITRRGMFRQMGRRLAGTRRQPEETGTTTRRGRLLDEMRAWPPSTGRTARLEGGLAGFGTVRVDGDRCSACALCARFCPTDALEFIRSSPDNGDHETFAIQFQPALCVACRVCEAACPEQALSVDPGADATAVREATVDVAAAGSLVQCTACGSATASGESRCFSCRPGVVTTLHDEIGLMRDLLARRPVARS